MSINAFVAAEWAMLDDRAEKGRAGIKFDGPRRTPRETLLSERPPKVLRVKVKDCTPANVLLGRALGIMPESTATVRGVDIRCEAKPRPHSSDRADTHTVNAPTVPEPRWYRWRPGATPEECQPVW
jgi:hypothetical protein